MLFISACLRLNNTLMKVTCKVCNTSKTIKEEKLEPYRGKIISTKCANKSCTNRIKFKVPLLKENKQDTIKAPKITETTNEKADITVKPTPKKEITQPKIDDKQVVCPNCKAVLTEETNFCMECGHKIVKPPEITKLKSEPKPQPQKKKCINCGKEYETDEKFCSHCGTPKDKVSKEITPKPQKSIKKQPEKTTEVVPEKKPDPKPVVKEKIDSKAVQQPIPKTKKKRGCLSILWKVAVAVVVLISVAVVAIVVLDDSKEYELADGPWEVSTLLSENLYTGYKGNNRKLKEAVTKANAEYATTFNASSIDIPILGNFEPTDEVFLFDQYSPNKKDDFYLFTIKNPEMNGGELRIILHLKSDDYFEGKGFFISKNKVSIGYLKGNLKK